MERARWKASAASRVDLVGVSVGSPVGRALASEAEARVAEAVRLEEEGRRRRAARARLIAERGERQRQAARALRRREGRKEKRGRRRREQEAVVGRRRVAGGGSGRARKRRRRVIVDSESDSDGEEETQAVGAEAGASVQATLAAGRLVAGSGGSAEGCHGTCSPAKGKKKWERASQPARHKTKPASQRKKRGKKEEKGP